MKKLFKLGPVTVHYGDISVLILGFVVGVASSYFANWLWNRRNGNV